MNNTSALHCKFSERLMCKVHSTITGSISVQGFTQSVVMVTDMTTAEHHVITKVGSLLLVLLIVLSCRSSQYPYREPGVTVWQLALRLLGKGGGGGGWDWCLLLWLYVAL